MFTKPDDTEQLKRKVNMALKAKLYDLKRKTTLPPHLKNYTEVVLPNAFDKYRETIENFEVRDDDVWVASFPKSGTTWTQEMVWLIDNNYNYEAAKKPLDVRYGFIEVLTIIPPSFMNRDFIVPDPIERLVGTVGKRFIKTHLPWELLPLQIRNGTKTPKIIYVMRNVKDVLVSWFYHVKLFEEDKVKLDNFFELFITDNYTYSPYWENILGFWNKRHLPNILFLQYEEMIRDLPSVINRTASFLETSVPPGEMEKLLHHLSFAEMKKNNAVNMEPFMELFKKDLPDKTSFIRKGKVGSYREELSEEMIQLLDIWIEVNIQNTGFKYNASNI